MQIPMGGIDGVTCAGSEAELDDPGGSLPTQHILWFYNFLFVFGPEHVK